MSISSRSGLSDRERPAAYRDPRLETWLCSFQFSKPIVQSTIVYIHIRHLEGGRVEESKSKVQMGEASQIKI